MPKKTLTLIFVIFVLFIIVFFVPFRTALVFSHGETGQLDAYLILSEDDHFWITFTHSIHLTDVVEKYLITDDHAIMQYEMIYEEFGIGMPSNATGDEEFEYIDGKYHITNMTNEFPYMNIRNGKVVSNHRLTWDKEGDGENVHTVPFNDYFTPGDWYKLEVKRMNLMNLLKGVSINE